MKPLTAILTKSLGEIELRIHNHLEEGREYYNELRGDKKVLSYLEINTKENAEKIINKFIKKYPEGASPIHRSATGSSFYCVKYPSDKTFELQENFLNYFSDYVL